MGVVTIKIKQLQGLIADMNERQRWIRKEMNKSRDREYKDTLRQEHQDNSSALRIMYWVLWGLMEIPTEEKKRRDCGYLDWFRQCHGMYIHDFLAKKINLSDSEYKRICYYGEYFLYRSQESIYRHICEWLFPKKHGGLFGMISEESIENDVWIQIFDALLKTEK